MGSGAGVLIGDSSEIASNQYSEACRQILKRAFERRKAKSPQFSLRAYSKRIGVSPTSLSQLLSGKRLLTPRMAGRISDRLLLEPREREELLKSAIKSKFPTIGEALDRTEYPLTNEIALDKFRLISDWYHYAILNLFKVKDCRPEPKWFAARLGMSLREVEQALCRLVRLQLVEKAGRFYKRTTANLETPSDTPDAMIRRFHQQLLVKAGESLEREDVSARDFGAIVLAANTQNLKRAKTALKRFRREISSLLSEGECTQVYAISTLLFPLETSTSSKMN